MTKPCKICRDFLITAAGVFLSYISSVVVWDFLGAKSLIPSIFVLGTFLISVFTDGYMWGLISTAAGVLAVNFAFMFPFYKINFSIPENFISAVIMIIVSVITGAMITKLKKQEILKAENEKERMRTNLMRAVSHDLRTPLTTIYGASSAILENDLTEDKKQELLHGICQDAEWLSRMVENLLSVTRVDGDDMHIIKSPMVLDELIDSVLVKLKKRYPNYDVEIDIPDECVVIPMDAMLMQQVLINILENAMLHAEGMTELLLKVSVSGNKAIFEIKDNGIGIDEDRVNALLEGSFESKKPSADVGKNNAGIGLSVCASIIKAHGGKITAENQRKGGALFRFMLDTEDFKDE